MPFRTIYIALVVALIGNSPLPASGQGASAAWRDLTLADVEAAYDIIARNHPAAVAAAGDSAFRNRLTGARAEARGRARDVASYEGWLATLRAFAVAFDDPHISLGTRRSSGTVRWPGFVVARSTSARAPTSARVTWKCVASRFHLD